MEIMSLKLFDSRRIRINFFMFIALRRFKSLLLCVFVSSICWRSSLFMTQNSHAVSVMLSVMIPIFLRATPWSFFDARYKNLFRVLLKIEFPKSDRVSLALPKDICLWSRGRSARYTKQH